MVLACGWVIGIGAPRSRAFAALRQLITVLRQLITVWGVGPDAPWPEIGLCCITAFAETGDNRPHQQL